MTNMEPSQPTEVVVVTASAPVHPTNIVIQEGSNVVSVKVVDEPEVWDLFCPSALKRITVTIRITELDFSVRGRHLPSYTSGPTSLGVSR